LNLSVQKGRSRPPSVVDSLCRQLADEIVEGALQPGARLDEVGLASRFGVSRTPVREALRQLEATGLVQRRPNRGVVVTLVSRERLAAMFEAMAEVEAVCARLAAARMTTAERTALQRLHAEAAAHAAAGAEARYENANRRFHGLLYDGAHNAELSAIAASMRARIAPFRRAQFRVPGRIARSWDEHDRVVRAILAGDGQAAEAAMRAHLMTVRDAAHDYRSAKGEIG
jgi:DNA-binding GntR family transcriptional regulator